MNFFTDETIKRHIKKHGKACYIKWVQEKLEKWEENYLRQKAKLEHILERIEKDFKDE